MKVSFAHTKLCALAVLAVSALTVHVNAEASISGILPNEGSLEGGTIVRILGVGFNRGGVEGSTKVYFGTNEAQVVRYHSSDNVLEVITPPLASDTRVTVSVDITQTDKAYNAACKASNCYFYYQGGRTPEVWALTRATYAGALYQVYGRLRGSDVSKFDIRVGGAVCDVEEDLNEESIPRDTTIQCRTNPTVAGRHGVKAFTDISDSGVGHGNMRMPSDKSFARLPLDAEDVEDGLYYTTVYPSITATSSVTGGTAGGAEFTVEGFGFSNNADDNQVMLDGVPCTVTEATDTKLVCTTGEYDSASRGAPHARYGLSGPTGALVQLWESSPWSNINVFNTDPRVPNSPTQTHYQVDGIVDIGGGFNFDLYHCDQCFQRVSGYFVPPLTTSYSFYIIGDDYNEFYLSSDAHPSNNTLLCRTRYNMRSYWQDDEQISEAVHLVAGERYFFEARSVEGGGQDFLNVAVRIADVAGYASDAVLERSSIREQQVFDIDVTAEYETQAFQITGANAGSFRIAVSGRDPTSGSATSGLLDWDASSGEVKTELDKLRPFDGCWSLSVSRSDVMLPDNGTDVLAGYEWTVEFRCPSTADYPTLNVINYNVRHTELDPPFPLSLPPTTRTEGSEWVEGTFTVSNDLGATTPPLHAHIGAYDLKLALEALNETYSLQVSRSGHPLLGYAWTITFDRPMGDVPQLHINGSSLTGTDVAVVNFTQVDGDADDLFLDPVPADYLEVAPAMPTVEVFTNGLKAVCEDVVRVPADPAVHPDDWPSFAEANHCHYIYDADLVATVTAVSPSSVTGEDVFTITGTGFTQEPTVTIGTADCAVTAFTETSITCTVGAGAVSADAPLVVVVGSNGKAVVDAGVGAIAYTLTVSSMSPTAGSAAGGTLLKFSGYGFSSTDVIVVGGVDCPVVEATAGSLVCVTGNAGAPAAAVAVTHNGVTLTPTFDYDASLTAVVSGFTPSQFSSAISTMVTVTLTNVLAGSDLSPVVKFGSGDDAVDCATRSVDHVGTDMTIRCYVLRDFVITSPQPAALPISVSILPRGLADASAAPDLDRRFAVTSVSPAAIGTRGGARLVIDGHGLGAAATVKLLDVTDSDVVVATCDVDADASSATSIECDVVTDHTPAALVSPDDAAAGGGGGGDGGHDHATRILRMLSVPTAADENPAPTFHDGHLRRLAADEDIGTYVQVIMNRIKAACEGACNVNVSAALDPVITSAGLLDGFDDKLQINGTDLAVAGAMVTLGAAHCPVDAALSVEGVSLVCTLPAHPASQVPIRVNIDGVGYAKDPAALTHTFPLAVTGIDVVQGSAAGGSMVTLTGTGFAPYPASDDTSGDIPTANTVTFGTVAAHVKHANTTSMTVMTMPASASLAAGETQLVSVSVMVAGGWSGYTGMQMDTLADAFTYSEELTPTLASLSATEGSDGTVVNVTGTRFGALPAGSSVAVGESGSCVIHAGTWTDTRFTCTVSEPAAGRNRFMVSIDGLGYAMNPSALTFSGLLTVSATVAPSSGSLVGGQTVVVEGEGFASAHRTHVVMCGRHAKTLSSTYNTLTVETPELPTLAGIASMSHVLPAALHGAVTGTSVGPHDAFDGDLTTATSGSWGCSFNMDMGQHDRAVLTRFRFYPTIRQEYLISRGTFVEVSNDESTWETVATLDGRIEAGWNYVDIAEEGAASLADRTPYRYLRMRTEGGYCRFVEVQFVGYNVSTSTDGVCDATVQVHPDSHFAADDSLTAPAGTYTYSESLTPLVTGVDPAWGTALGGTEVVLTGSNLDAVAANNHVRLNGVMCDVSAATSTSVTCTTRPRGHSFRDFSVALSSSALGTAAMSATDAPSFRYLDRWSDVTTWTDQEPPKAGDTVVVPHGQAVLLDTSPPRLFVLIVQGVLVFDHDTPEIALDASYIYVQGGVLEVGTEDDPYLGRATITLHGDRWTSVELPEIGTKMIAVTDYPTVDHAMHMSGAEGTAEVGHDFRAGVLDLHGRPRMRSWVKLNGNVAAGGDVLELGEPVDWEAGDRLVVTSSDVGMAHTEEVTVAEVLSATSLRVTPPLRYARLSEVLNYDGWSPVDLRPEVGLLSRNIVIQGDEGSDKQLFGVHTMAAHSGTYHVENVELRRCGQSGHLGRYCTHFHMMGSKPGNYVRDNSIHHSYQRAVTIHGSHDVTVKNNVAYHVRGHTFFVEDGNEERSLLENNLGVYTLKHPNMLKSDTKPATFWTPTPRCFWRHNVAAGSASFGFWFELVGHPTGPSFTTALCPNDDHLGEFYNNTAHSSNSHGLRVYPHWQPHEDPCDTSTPPAPQYLHDLTSWRNGGNGVFHRDVGSLHHMRYKLVENGGEEVFWKKLLGTNGIEHISYYQDLLAIGTRNDDPATHPTGKGAMWGPQEDYWFIGPATFVNYGGGVLKGCAECGSQTALKQGGYTVRFQGLTFVNSPVRTAWTPPRKQIFWDLDGTLTGHVNGTLSPYWAFNDYSIAGTDEPCGRAPSETYGNAILCDGREQMRRVRVDGVDPSRLDWQPLTVSGVLGAGEQAVSFLPKEHYGWVFPAVTNRHYHLSFTDIDWQTMNIKWGEPAYVRHDEHSMFSTEFTDFRLHYEVMYDGDWRPWRDDRLPVATDRHGTGAMGRVDHSVANNTFTWVMNDVLTTPGGPNTHALTINALQCPRAGCPLPPEPVPGEYMLWSNPDAWPSGVVPAPGSDVTITNVMSIILDDNFGRFGKILVEGRLRFKDGTPLTLECDALTVLGELHIGSADSPFTAPATIVLHGTRASPTVVVDDAYFLGNKLFAVFGTATIVGVTPSVVWTDLAETAVAGATSFKVSQSVDPAWAPGDRIVLTPTDYDIDELETVTVDFLSEGGTRVHVVDPLQYTHKAEFVSVPGWNGDENGQWIAGSAGHVSRNVRIVGGNPGTTNYGGHVVVGEIVRETRSIVGTVHFQGVEFNRLGKENLEHAAFTVRYQQDDNPHVVVDSCTFTDTFNDGFVADHASHVRFRNNVIHSTTYSAVSVSSSCPDAVVTNNLVAGNYRAPSASTTWVNPQAGFLIDVIPAEFSGNTAAGCADAGITIRPPSCSSGEGTSSRWAGNSVHSAMIGVFFLSHSAGGERCVEWANSVVHKVSHVGYLSVDMLSSVVLDSVVLSDSHIGVSLNYFGSAEFGHSGTVRNSLIMGSTAASSCDASLTCHAMTGDDVAGVNCNSVMGSQWRRVGIMSSQHTNRAKTCEIDKLSGGGFDRCRPPHVPERLCGMPWEKRYGLPAANVGRLFIEGVTFAHWSSADCGMNSTAYAANPTQRDFTPHAHFSDITWLEAPKEARLYIGLLPVSEPACTTNCDSYDFGALRDVDGTLLGGEANAAVIPDTNPALTLPSPSCHEVPEWGAFECAVERPLIPMTLRDMDRNVASRRLGPIVLNPPSNRTLASTGPHDDPCPKRFFFPFYNWMVVAGEEYVVRAANTLPKQTRLFFTSSDTSHAVLFKLFLQRPNEMEVLVNRVLVPRQTTMPTLSDPAGTNMFDPHAKTLYVVLRGGSGVSQVYDIVRTAKVQLDVKLAISVEEFFAEDFITNMARLLEIKESQIRIVSVTAGSVSVKTEIVDDAPPAVEEEEKEEQYQRLATIGTTVTQLVQSGQFDVGYQLETVALAVPSIDESVEDSLDAAPAPIPPKEDSSSFPVLAVALAVGGAAVVVGVVGAVLLVRHRRKRVLPKDRFSHENPMRTKASVGPDGRIIAQKAQLGPKGSGEKDTPPLDSQGNWSKFWDSTHKRFYWFNATDQSSSWTAPSGWEEPVKPHSWNRVWDDTSQRPYWYNDVTGETVWSTPKEVREERQGDASRRVFTPTRTRASSGAPRPGSGASRASSGKVAPDSSPV